MKKRGFNFKLFIICILIVFIFLGGIGSLFSSKSTNSDWYQSIKPSITPPSFVFPIVWNFLFLLISLSLYFAWSNAKSTKQKKNIVILFGINFILNLLWSILFFGLREPLFAFVDIILLWISILLIIIKINKISSISSWLLVPYLVWVSFASILNFLIAF